MDNLVSLSKLFDKRIFRIPDYQRGYAWGKAQLDDFWDDLINLIEDRYHYTGMLSLKKLKSNIYSNWSEEKWIIEEKEYEAYHIVDGQQRLTTFIILVNSILDFAKSNSIEYLNGDELEEIKTRFIVEYKKPQKILKTFKFGYESDNPSSEYLRYNILGEGVTGTLVETFYTLNLEKAKYYFDEKINEYYLAEGLKGLESLFRKLVNKFQFNIHDIDDDFDVFVAFETMNNRGKRLSNLEILKNRIIYLTTLYPDTMLSNAEKEQLRGEINDCWKEVYHELGRNKKHPLDDDEYLKNHWTMYFKYSRNKGEDYIKFLLGQYFSPKAIFGLSRMMKEESTNTFDEEYIPLDEEAIDDIDGILYPQEIKAYIDSLKEVAQYWYYSFNPSECSFFTEKEKVWIDRLNRIGINYFRTLVVATYINNDILEIERIRLFETIEKFIFLCFRMARYQSSYLSHIAYSYARNLMKKELNIQEVINYFEEKFRDNISGTTDIFLSKMSNAFRNNEGYYSWHDIKYFLYEYEQSLSEKTFIKKLNDWNNFTKNEKDKISIEHIFPQTPTRWYWRNQFRNYSKEEQVCLANSLGNLLPLSQSVNSALQNDEFEIKKKGNESRKRGYSNGCYSEMEVAKEPDWNPTTILARGLKLLKFMEGRWGFKFKDEIKIDLLGLSFMKEPREELPELNKNDMKNRDDRSILEENSMRLSDYLNGKKQEMIDLYSALFEAMKERIPDLYEAATQPYIAFRNQLGSNIAEVRVQTSQIRINIKEPINQSNKIGERNAESYNWSLGYKVFCKKFDDIEKVCDAIMDSYYQLV